MSQVVKAIYENGFFRPLESVSLAEHETVSLIVQSGSNAQQAAADVSSSADFDRQLDLLLFDGPSLPVDFSRADIYCDHG
jgi:predicted DNA-binding antitoxin AbrB/MazE fold protein